MQERERDATIMELERSEAMRVRREQTKALLNNHILVIFSLMMYES